MLGIYFRHFANYDKTYGTLGAAIALSVWLYWVSFILLMGAEINALLLRSGNAGAEGNHRRLESHSETIAATDKVA